MSEPPSVREPAVTAPADAAAPAATPKPRRSRARRILLVAGGLVLLLLVALVGGLFYLPQVELAGLASARLTASLGRNVTVESLRVTPGRSFAVTARGLRLDNLPGGTRPAMAEVASLTAEFDPRTLVTGPLVLRRAELEGVRVLLERGPDGTRNWRFGAAATSPPTTAPSGSPATATPAETAPAPTGRANFPALLDARVRDAEIVFRTRGGTALTTRIETGTVSADAPDAPVTLRIDGTYQGVPLRLEGLLESVLALRDASHPYGTTLRFSSGDTTLAFEGTMTDPVNVDGASGLLTLAAPSPTPLPRFAGLDEDFDGALDLSGVLEHRGGLWALTGAEGALNGDAVSIALLRLQEGGEGPPDTVTADVTFDRLDLNELIGREPGNREGGGEDRSADLPLALDARQDPVVEAKIAARELVYARLRATDARIAANLGQGRLEVERLELTTSGARVTASARAETAGEATRITATAATAAAPLDALRRAFGFGPLPVNGPVTAQIAVSGEGRSLNAAARGARVSAIVSMRGGSVSRSLFEAASTDIRRLFRDPRGNVPVNCLVAALDMRGGVGEVAPLRLRASAGIVTGEARFDLNRETLDLVIGSESTTTGTFALDVPVRVSGSFADPTVRPATWSGDGRARLSRADDVASLPPSLLAAARANPCFRSDAPGVTAPRRR